LLCILFEVFLQLCGACVAMNCPMTLPNLGVGDKLIGLVFVFLLCRNLISSFILIVVTFFCVCLCAGEVLGILILAWEGVSFLIRHCLLK